MTADWIPAKTGDALLDIDTPALVLDLDRFELNLSRLMEVANRLFAQSAAMGALPTLYAATAADIRGGEYIGPLGLLGMRGAPSKVRSSARSHDRAVAARLWQVSEEMTGVRYDLPVAQPASASAAAAMP